MCGHIQDLFLIPKKEMAALETYGVVILVQPINRPQAHFSDSSSFSGGSSEEQPQRCLEMVQD